MKAVGIICEYNPIHNGHVRQIEYARTMGADTVVCVMSGNFTQRGEFTIADKYTRAKSAIAAGADVVFELPFPFSSMSAEFFARAGVYVLSKLGVETLCFGHECDDINILKTAADVITDESFTDMLDQRGAQGNAKSFFDAFKEVTGTEYTLGSNDILGAYYIAAINKIAPEMNILPIKREGSAYNDQDIKEGTLPSANAIRNTVYPTRSFKNIPTGVIPENALSTLIDAEENGLAPVLPSAVSDEILSFFRLLSVDGIKSRAISLSGGDAVLDDGNGIVERLVFCANNTSSFDEMLIQSYNSRFTNSRMRRVCLFTLFGVSNALKSADPEYTTLLAASIRGREFLSCVRKTASIKIVTKPADAPKDSVQYKLSSLADTVYASAIPKKALPAYFQYLSPFVEH